MTASNRTIAEMYRGQRLHDRNVQACTAKTVGVAHMGALVAIHARPMPPVEEYDRFVSLQLAGTRGVQSKITGAKLRRMVVMRSQGSSFAECARGAGFAGGSVAQKWLDALPIELRP